MGRLQAIRLLKLSSISLQAVIDTLSDEVSENPFTIHELTQEKLEAIHWDINEVLENVKTPNRPRRT